MGRSKRPRRSQQFARPGLRGMDEAVREFVLTSYEAGVPDDWEGWLGLIRNRFGHDDRDAVRHAWNRVHNELQRERLLVEDPKNPCGPMRSPSQYPQVRFLSLPEAIKAVEQLIASGGWVADEKGLRLWQ